MLARSFALLLLLCLVAAGSAQAWALADPIEGSWTNSSGGAIAISATSATHLAGKVTAAYNSGNGCPHPVGQAVWEIDKQSDGSYSGINHGFADSQCADEKQSTTWRLLSATELQVCVSGYGCGTLTRPALPTPGPVPIETVSNGCGGAGWDAFVKFQNYLGNTSVYKDSNKNPLARSYTVNFKDACDLHDAGYAGAVVRDKLAGGRIADFRQWSRKQVDDKFLADMRLLCERQIPATAFTAKTNCKGRGGNSSFGAESRYNLVRRIGYLFFDADLSKPGTQRTGPRANN